MKYQVGDYLIQKTTNLVVTVGYIYYPASTSYTNYYECVFENKTKMYSEYDLDTWLLLDREIVELLYATST